MTQLKFRNTPSPRLDVVAIVAMEGRADHGVRADMAEAFAEQRVPLRTGRASAAL
jgi:hypothetical protein